MFAQEAPCVYYVVLYTEKLKNNHQLFQQQKLIINSQLKASSSLFKYMLAGEDFKEKAREYLQGIGLL